MTTQNVLDTTLAGQTGTGSHVGSTSPAIITPAITTGINDVNANPMLYFSATASANNYFSFLNSVSGGSNAIGMAAVGADTNIIMSLAGKGTGRAQIKGTGSNDNASTGFVGEEMESVILSGGSPVSLSNGTAKTMVSLTLTAGDWDIWGNVFFNISNTATYVEVGISKTNNTLPDNALIGLIQQSTLNGTQGINAPGYRVSIASSTTYYLIAICGFSSGTCTTVGGLYARRRS